MYLKRQVKLSIWALILASNLAYPQVFRMQGQLLDGSNNPIAGSVQIVRRVDDPVAGPVVTLNNGHFDIQWDPGYTNQQPNGQLGLMYWEPEETRDVNLYQSHRTMFELDFWTGRLVASPYNSGNISMIKGSPLPDEFKVWCGIKVRKLAGTQGFQFDGSRGWCPAEYDRLSTIVSQGFPAGNLVANGSFEGNQSGSDFYRWSTAGLWSGDPSPIYHPLGLLKPRSGKAVAAIDFLSPSSGALEKAFLATEPFKVKPNTNYLLSFYYSAKSPINWGTQGVRPMVKTFASRVGPEVFDMESGRHGATSYGVSENTWVRYYHPFKTGPSAVFATVELLRVNSYGTGGVFYFDDVLVVEADPSASPGDHAFKISNSTIFADGRNKPIQSKVQKGSVSIVTQTEYDDFQRAKKASLPVAMNFSGTQAPNGYVPDIFALANELYNGTSFPNAGNYAFTETKFEAAPSGRALSASFAGYNWRLGGGHTLDQYYTSTTSLDGEVPAPPGSPELVKYSLSESKGQHYQKSRVFKDKLGQVARTSQEMRFAERWVSTDYEYDDNGNLTKVTSPPGPGGVRTSIMKTYNSLGQVLSEDSPDLGLTLFIYDGANRLRFSQSQAQRESNPARFSYAKYDAMDRITESGEYLETEYFYSGAADDKDFPYPFDKKRVVRNLNFYDRRPMQKNYCMEGVSDVTYIIRSDAPGGSMNEFQTWDDAYVAAYYHMSGLLSFTGKLRFYQVFDSPSHVIRPPTYANYTPFGLLLGQRVGFVLKGILRGSQEFNDIVGSDFPFAVNWGPLEGRLVQTVSCNPYLGDKVVGSKTLTKAFNYDIYGNITDIYEYNGYIQNPAKRWQKAQQRYDAQSRLLERKLFADATSTDPEASFSYSYNEMGQLDEVKDNTLTVLAKHSYNALGQLTNLTVGQGPGRVIFNYAYHLRGWIKKIEANSENGTRLYLQELKYEDGTLPRFDGNISEYNYALTTQSIEKFSYSYGDLDRLASAMTTLRPEGQTTNPQWSYTYFDNGVISSATKLGQVFTYKHETVEGGYTGNSNRLKSVTFTGSHPRNTSGANNFEYDASGRMNRDNSQQMTIQYTGDDRPYKFDYVRGGNLYTQFMIYDEGGNRRSKVLYRNNSEFVSAQHYGSNGKEIREFASQPLVEIYPLDGFGRIVKNSAGESEYEVYISNHIGSTVKVYNVTNNSPVYQTDYEPYGKLRLQTSSTSIPITGKYTGKENDEGLDLTYFGARYYDSELAIWISPDPARQFHSPYGYGPSPINGVDPDGRQFDQYSEEWGNISHEDGVALMEQQLAEGPPPTPVEVMLQIAGFYLMSDIRIGGGFTFPDGTEVKFSAGSEFAGVQVKFSAGTPFVKAGTVLRWQYNWPYEYVENPGWNFVTNLEADRTYQLPTKLGSKVSGSVSLGYRGNWDSGNYRVAAGYKRTLPWGGFLSVDLRSPSINPSMVSD